MVLRDPTGAVALHVLEQNYRADAVSQGLLLSLNEGKEIDFLIPGQNGEPERKVRGKIIRSGYQMHNAAALQRYGQRYAMNQRSYAGMASGDGMQPIIEVEGQLRFGLPGNPLFPALADDTVLKPTLAWRLHSEKDAKVDAEVGYLTGGMSWDAAYNVVSPENGDTLDLSGWVTMDNQSGKTFRDAKVQLIAGDVAKVNPDNTQSRYLYGASTASIAAAPQVTEQSFDEYHLYSLPLPVTLRDRETKQVEFVRAAGIAASRLYVYDGVKIDRTRYGSGTPMENIRGDENYGTESNPKVWVMREIANTEANHLGLPLPKGTVRFYRRDADGQLQFTGENLIDHTPQGETLRIYTGNAFDLVGERKRLTYQSDQDRQRWFEETFEITLRNRKKEPAEIRVVEHLYRWTNWIIQAESDTFSKTDAQTIEFRIPLQPEEERKVTYTVRYSW